MPEAAVIPITTSSTPPGESITDLINLHKQITRLVDRNFSVMSDQIMDALVITAGDIRFDIAKAPARDVSDILAKAMFFLEDHVEVGPCEKFAAATLKGVRADLRRLEVTHV